MNNFQAKVRFDQFDVASRLSALGLAEDILKEAISAGYVAWDACTDLDPRMFPGLSMWAVTVRRLRQLLLVHGWTYSDDGNFPLTISPDQKIAICVATGDKFTGDENNTPSTQSQKGPKSAHIVAINTAQLELDLNVPKNTASKQDDTCTTWLLLLHRTSTTVFAELSHPIAMDEYQRVAGWKERLVLSPVQFESDMFEITEDDSPDIDIDIRRRV